MILTKKTLSTIVIRSFVLLINFLLVVFTARVWGSEGRGLIALIMADVAIIIILNNVFAGATVAYHTPKTEKNRIFTIAWGGSLVLSFLGALIFSIIQGFHYFTILAGIALLTSWATSISFYWLGKNNIRIYNLIVLLPPLLLIIYLLGFYYVAGITNVKVYFLAWFLAYGTVWIFGIFTLNRRIFFRPVRTGGVVRNMVSYGFKSELSYFIQFLNYRLAYFFITFWLGLSRLGVFSVAIAVSEAMWIISKSFSAILYAEVLNATSSKERIAITEKALRNTLLLTTLGLIILGLIPEPVYLYLFGNEFTGVRILILYLFPGILAIALANIYGHYFSAIGKMTVLIVKSTLGFVVTVLFLYLLLKRNGLPAACLTLDLSYIASFVFLWYLFRKEKKALVTSAKNVD